MAIFTKNIDALRERYGDIIATAIHDAPLEHQLEIHKSKQSTAYTAHFAQKYLCSPYDPLREAQRLGNAILQKQRSGAHDGIIFLGFGLGYHIREAAKQVSDIPLLILEPSRSRIASVLRSIDYAELIRNDRIFFCFSEDAREILDIVKHYGIRIPLLWEQQQFTAHYAGVFQEISETLYRYSAQGRLNRNTLIKFSKKWIKNSIKNLLEYPATHSIDSLHNVFYGMPALLCAAGPSFDAIAPHLAQWKEKSVIVAVDTIVKRLQSLDCNPDIIVSMDPQYWNSRHLDNAIVQDSIVIVDSSTCPRVLRKIHEGGGIPFFAQSHFPLAAYLDPWHKTKLGAGGSVSTSAWDLCRLLGCSTVYCIGLDLGYPLNRTHARFSLYESFWSWQAHRRQSNETQLVQSLFNAAPYYVKNYADQDILSDARLELYSFWFSRAAQTVNACSLSPMAKKVDGIASGTPEIANTLAGIHTKKKAILKKLRKSNTLNTDTMHAERKKRIARLFDALLDLQGIIEQQLAIIDSCIKEKRLSTEMAQKLERLDSLLQENTATPFVNFMLQSAARSVFSFLGKDKALENSRGLYLAYQSAAVFLSNLCSKIKM